MVSEISRICLYVRAKSKKVDIITIGPSGLWPSVPKIGWNILYWCFVDNNGSRGGWDGSLPLLNFQNIEQ